MSSRPSSVVSRAPFALAMKTGSPPTPENARTGEFTPPAMYVLASSNNDMCYGPGSDSYQLHATEGIGAREARNDQSGVDRRGRSAHIFSMKAYMCLICGYLYDEERGDPESGIDAGTRWDDVPLSWRCPDCGAGKEDFEMVEV